MAKKRKQEPEPSDNDEEEADNNSEQEEEMMKEALSSEDEDEDHSAPDPTPTPVVASKNQSSMTSDGRYHNKQRLLVLSSRGITARYRHLLEDLRTLIPHSKKESKLDVGKFICCCVLYVVWLYYGAAASFSPCDLQQQLNTFYTTHTYTHIR